MVANCRSRRRRKQGHGRDAVPPPTAKAGFKLSGAGYNADSDGLAINLVFTDTHGTHTASLPSQWPPSSLQRASESARVQTGNSRGGAAI